MSKLTALALSIAVLGGVWAFLALGTARWNGFGLGWFYCLGMLLSYGRGYSGAAENYRRYGFWSSHCRYRSVVSGK